MDVKERPRFYVITAKEIIETGKISFKFMFDSGSNIDLCLEFDYFGFAEVVKKDDNYVNPFKLMRGESGAIGDDGIKRLNVNVFESGKGFVFGGSVDGTDEGMQEFVKNIPGCVLLMHEDIFDKFNTACEKNNIAVEHFAYSGALKTA
ncbi:MAG: hypothetical protein ACM3UU_00695 [Ignavibacteriales bacterium]